MPKPTIGAKARAKFVAQRLVGGGEAIRGFHHTSEARYAKSSLDRASYKDEVNMGLFCKGGGVQGEMSVRWIDLRSNNITGSEPWSPQLQVFDDGWAALYSFADVLEEMSEIDNQSITPKQFCKLLLRCGFKDLTARERKEDAA